MFNRTTIHRTTTEVTPVTRVIEKTISPDKVSDMYKEVKNEVEKKILRTFVFNDNKVNGVVVELEPDYAQRIQHILLRFTVNGKEVLERFTRPSERLANGDAYKILVEAFAERVWYMVAQIAGIKLNFPKETN